MPIVLGSLHLIAAAFFAVHCVRTHQNMYWLGILFAFPFLGSVAYFFGIYAPASRLEHHARRVVSQAAQLLDPERELRAAEEAFEEAATVQNRIRLADAQTERGLFEAAAQNYDACLKGPFGSDPALRLNIARCLLETGQPGQALEHLQTLREKMPRFQSETFSLLLAKAYAATNDQHSAHAEFEQALAQYGSFGVLAEYAIWAFNKRDLTTAAQLMEKIEHKTRRWDKGTRQLNASLLQKLEAASRLSQESTREPPSS